MIAPKRIRNVIAIVITGTFLVGICAATVLFIGDHDSLLPRATKIVDLGTLRPGETTYAWASDTNLIWLRDYFNDKGHKTLDAKRFDLFHHKVVNLGSLERAITAEVNRNQIPSWRFSKDGNLLLISGQDRVTGFWEVLDYNGNCLGKWKSADDGSPSRALWLPDGRHWVEVAESTHHARIVTHETGSPDSQKVVQDFMPSYYIHLGFVSPSVCFAVTPRVGDGDVSVVEYDIASAPVPRRTFFLKTPDGVTGSLEAAISPEGKRVAWLFGYRTGPLGLSILGRLPRYRYAPPSQVGLWISDTKGNGMRLIGSLETNKGAPETLRWTPNGKRVSFSYQEAIWTVPVD